MIHVIATIELRPGRREEFLTVFRDNLAAVRAEDGCIEYGPALDADTGIASQTLIGPDKVMVIEKWESVEALKAHAVAPHMQAYRATTKDWVLNTEIRVLEPA